MHWSVFYKTVSNLVDIVPDYFLTPASQRTRSDNSLNVQQISVITCILDSFIPRTISLWNTSPTSVAEALTLALLSWSSENFPTGLDLSSAKKTKEQYSWWIELCWSGFCLKDCYASRTGLVGYLKMIFLSFYRLLCLKRMMWHTQCWISVISDSLTSQFEDWSVDCQ